MSAAPTVGMTGDTAPPKRLLVVDDEPLLVRILAHLLGKAGFIVVTALDGRATDTAQEVLARIAATAPGAGLRVRVTRGPEVVELEVTAGERPRTR
jgi:CheY-like chemotaxis protein